jgi:DNA-binding transcriptional LysR family regulator
MILGQSMAVAGLGVALVSPILCHAAIESGAIHPLLEMPAPAEDCFCLTVSEAAARRAAVQAFCAWLEETTAAARG